MTLGSIAAGPAHAAPVFTQASLTVDLGFGTAPVTVGGSGFVDVAGSTVMVPAGLVNLGFTIFIPVTATTQLSSFSLMTLSNASATFSLGGVTARAPGEVCTGASHRRACNAGGGVGGTMGLEGRILVNILPHMPFPIFFYFDQLRVGRGGSTNIPVSLDAAAWSTGTGYVGFSSSDLTVAGASGPLNLVSPSYWNFLGERPFLVGFTLTNVSLPVPEANAALLVGCVGLGLVLWSRS